jgi:hypothetical protein
VSGPRYAIILPHKLSGRREKRLLNRARSCEFCRKPLGADRRLLAAVTDLWHRDLVPAHPACAEAENRRIDAERKEERRRQAPARELFMLDQLAEMMRREDEAILYGRAGSFPALYGEENVG